MIALKRRVVPNGLLSVWELDLDLVSLTEVCSLLFTVIITIELAVSFLPRNVVLLVVIKTSN